VSLVKTIKISEAKRNFSRIFARAKRGETIILQNGNDFMQLVPCAVPELVPIRPLGYFALDAEDVAFINSCQQSSLTP
jgi:antitoxin (DNA-binding transcriptional repressor) of toxin-antitoxin stability system